MNSWLARLAAHLQVPTHSSETLAKDLEALQRAVDGKLPPAFEEFVLWLGEDVDLDFSWEMNLFHSGRVLRVEEMRAIQAGWRKPNPVGTLGWWRPEWVPFLEDESGIMLCLDLEGSFGNPAGSILEFNPKLAPRPVVFPDFAGWLRWVAQSMDQGWAKVSKQPPELVVHLGKGANKLYKDFFPAYPKPASAEVMGMSMLDQALFAYRKGGLQIGPRCTFPANLPPAEFERAIASGFVRDEGGDGIWLRALIRWPGWGVYALLTPTPQRLVVERLVAVPELVSDLIRNALSLEDLGQKSTAASRLAQAAFEAHKAGNPPVARMILHRALQLDPQHDLAKRSMEALVAKGVELQEGELRPLLKALRIP
jgi:hypothetical protein